MTRAHALRLAPALVGLALALQVMGCEGTSERADPGRLSPEAIAEHECAVCGMLVRDQPAPRGQLVHGDGTRAFTCSVGDLLVHLGAPSPHGRVAHVWVEVMTPTESPAQRATHAHDWVPADEAFYVVGVERRGIMGPPVLAYAKRADAEQRASMHDEARVLDRDGLEAWWAQEQR